jgi:hypothetical protein
MLPSLNGTEATEEDGPLKLGRERWGMLRVFGDLDHVDELVERGFLHQPTSATGSGRRGPSRAVHR